MDVVRIAKMKNWTKSARGAFVAALAALCMALTATVVMAPTVAQAQDVKIAYVDLQKALNEVDDGKKAKAQLKKMFDERQKQLDAQQEELKTFKEKLEGEIEGNLLSDDAKREKVMEYQKKFTELQALYVQLQRELTEAEAKETKKIFVRFQKILKDIGLEKGYTVILEKTESSVLWAPDSLNITDELVKRYNSGQ